MDKAVEAEDIVPVTAIPDAVTMAMFADPAGACVGLVEADVCGVVDVSDLIHHLDMWVADYLVVRSYK